MSQPLPHPFALLLAAHGERRAGAGNDGVVRLAAELAGRGVADEVGIGFIKGIPTIDEALRAFACRDVLVYPLFLSDGYFNRVRLPQFVAKVGDLRHVRVLPPLGLDPALAVVVAGKAEAAARATGIAAGRASVVLLAHGSSSDPASREATEAMAGRLGGMGRFRAVHPAFLEERPSLAEVIAATDGPVVVVGLFAGEGLHGGADVPQLLGAIARRHLAFAGNIGTFADVAEIVARAVRHASTGDGERID